MVTALSSYMVAGLAYHRDHLYDRWVAMFIVSFSTIQTLEAILWKNLDNPINHMVTRYAIPLVLASQGIVALYGANQYTTVPWEMWMVYAIVGSCVYYICANQFDRTMVSRHGNLVWRDNVNVMQGLVFMVYIALPFYLYMTDDLVLRDMVIGGIVLTLVGSCVVYRESWQSNWCFFANILSLYVLARHAS
jgi:hypothetical protein